MTDALLARAAELTDVDYRYAGASDAVFQQQAWQVEAGSFTVVTGSSGSGKSTLLRLLNGLAPHFSGGSFGGSVTITGLDTLDVPTRELSRFAGFVFQDADASTITGRVEDEIAFGLEQLATPVPAMRRQVEELLILLGIEHLRDRQINTLSGGERQRVAIAAAMAMNPKVLILDEPTSQLDPSGADDVIQTLHRLNEEHAMTIVLAEHRLERVAQFADRLTILRRGLPMVDGPPREVFAGDGHRFSPSLFRAGEFLDWNPSPLSVREGRQHVRQQALLSSGPEFERRIETGPAAVALKGVELRHGQSVVLRNVDLTCHQGEIVAVMGANGSGKTTLLRSIVGFHPLAKGKVVVSGVSVESLPREAIGTGIGFLPQRSSSLLFNNSVREEIAFSLRHRAAPLESMPSLLEEFGLQGLEDRHPLDISVGEQESLALALTVAGNPPLLLFDEPTRGLDAHRKEQLARSLETRAAMGQCVVLSTHDVEFAASIADRIVLLGGGEIVADGTPRQVMDGSLVYGTQINKVFGMGLLTLNDVVRATNRPGFGDTASNMESSERS